MSNKPKIYATCPAGCLWETVHKDDFLRSASVVKMVPESDGTYHLELGKTYRIKRGLNYGEEEADWGFTLQAHANAPAGLGEILHAVSNPTRLEYNDFLKVRFLDFVNPYQLRTVTIEFDGVRETQKAAWDDGGSAYYDVYLVVSGAEECYLVNEDAVVQARDGNNVFIRYAYDSIGTEVFETWKSGMNYIGVYVGQEAPTDGGFYQWMKFIGEGSSTVAFVYAESLEWIEENGETDKMYMLPDGSVYAYSTYEAEVFTNVLADVGYTDSMRINSAGEILAWTSTPADVTGYIPCKAGDIIRLKNVTIPSEFESGGYSNYVGSYDASKTFISRVGLYYADDGSHEPLNRVVENDNVVQFTVAESMFGANVAYIVINAADINADSEVYVNSEIATVTGWHNTGNAFGSAELENRVTELETRIDSLESGTDSIGIPDYWLEELETKAGTIRQAMETAGRNKSAFLWYTDAHWLTNSQMSPALLKYLAVNTPINKVNFGGDIINDPTEFTHDNIKYAYDWRNLIAGLPNHHSVYGNHDVNHRTTDVSNIAYAFLLAPEETTNMVVGGDCYYYIDNPSEKTRYLYLSYLTNNHAEMVAQGEFIVDAISSVSEGWHIVVIAHRWFQYTSSKAPTVGSVPAYETEILKVFDEYNARTTHTASNYFAAQDFAEGKGKVEFCIGGHIHVDYDFTTDGGIPVIITASDTNQERSSDETEDSGTVGTITESAVFGIIADYDNSKISVIGVGRGTSRVVPMDGTTVTTYTVTNNLTNCTNSNTSTVMQEGTAYSATITANSGYTLESVTVTMGGSAVTVTNGVINIASVTGDIVITATATAEETGDTTNYSLTCTKPDNVSFSTPLNSSYEVGALVSSTAFTSSGENFQIKIYENGENITENVCTLQGGTSLDDADAVRFSFNINGNVVITIIPVSEVEPEPETYTITKTETNCSVLNKAESVTAGDSYSSNITANTGYELGTVTVKMGGVDITATVYENGNIYIPSVTGDIEITATATIITYSVTKNLTNCTMTPDISGVTHGGRFSVTITANDGYVLDSVTVKIDGTTDVTDSAYNSSTGKINISNVIADLEITAVAVAEEVTTHKVTNTLTNCTNSNGAASVNDGASYSANITADSGYVLDSVAVTMGGADITSSAYGNGSINISSVTGAIVIKATATLAESTDHTNVILSSIESDGTAYNGGTGYKVDHRLNSQGIEKSSTGCVASGFIPFNGANAQPIEIRIPTTTLNDSNNYLHLYGSDFAVIYQNAEGTTIDGSYRQLQFWVSQYGATYVTEDSTLKITIPAASLAVSNAKYIRVSALASTTVSSSTFDLALGESLD